MKKREIDRKMDEIVAFAEIEKFIDTPVKHYSSGMYVRLAFAVAAHLEPEILLVDEVLAVGDINFRRSAWGKWAMWRGRAHGGAGEPPDEPDAAVVSSGHVGGWRTTRMTGSAHEVVSAYESAMARGDSAAQSDNRGAKTKARFMCWRIVEPSTEDAHMLDQMSPTTIEFYNKSYRVHFRRPPRHCSF